MKQILILIGLLSAPGLVFGDKTALVDGREVILHDNYTWEYRKDSPSEPTSPVVIKKKSEQTKALINERKAYVLNFDPSFWTSSDITDPPKEFFLMSANKVAYAMTIYEKEEFPLEVLQDIILTNARNAGAVVELLSVRDAQVNEVAGKLIKYSVKLQNMDFTFLTFACSGKFGTIQDTVYAFSSYFSSAAQILTDTIGGLEINREYSPQ